MNWLHRDDDHEDRLHQKAFSYSDLHNSWRLDKLTASDWRSFTDVFRVLGLWHRVGSLAQHGLCRNVKDDGTCQRIFWHHVGIVEAVKKQDIYIKLALFNFLTSVDRKLWQFYLHSHVMITLQFLLWSLQFVLWILLLEIFQWCT